MSDSSKSTVDLVIPDIGDSNDVEVIELLVGAGDEINVDDSLLTLESDKASMEVPATHGGTIESLTVSVGDTVNAGDIVGKLSVGDTATVATTASATEAGKPAEQAEPDTSENPVQTESATNTPPATEKVATASQEASSPRPASPTAHISDDKMRAAHASPGVRRYAREHGADLSLVDGTGPKGRILKEDVVAFIKKAMQGMGTYSSSGGAATGDAGIPPIPEVDFSKFGEIERVELGRINKLSAANLHRAWLNLPMVTHHDLADVTEMEAFRKQLKAESGENDPKVTGLAFHMKALVQALKAFPKFNSSMSSDGESLFYKKY
ncbi:MAG: biotin/lipoyl-containing protein, partial [Granulosicoccus sp.]